jgi:hypothetical protein
MKYIAYYGAWGTVIISLGTCAMLFLVCLVIGITKTIPSTTELILMCCAIPFLFAISSLCAWIVCDMKKRMKDL